MAEFPYRVELSASARKEIRSMPPNLIARIMKVLKELGVAPRPSGAKKLAGPSGAWRVRMGDYRIIYRIDDSQHLVDIVRVAHRGEAYR